MVDTDRIAQAEQGEEARQLGAERRITGQPAQVALEQPMTGRVEAHQRHEEADVGLRHPLARQEGATVREPRLKLVQPCSPSSGATTETEITASSSFSLRPTSVREAQGQMSATYR